MDLAFKRFRVHGHFAYDPAQEVLQLVAVKAGHVIGQIVQNLEHIFLGDASDGSRVNQTRFQVNNFSAYLFAFLLPDGDLCQKWPFYSFGQHPCDFLNFPIQCIYDFVSARDFRNLVFG